jgi:hypothetical protein
MKKMLNSRGQPIRRRSLVSPGPCVKPVAWPRYKQTNKQIIDKNIQYQTAYSMLRIGAGNFALPGPATL